MIRINELRLPLQHAPDALPAAIAERLVLPRQAIRSFTVFKRSHDARKKNALLFIYTVDVEVAAADETALLRKFAADPKIRPTPSRWTRFFARFWI